MDKTETGRRIALRPVRYASVSGGKDSLYMLLHILQNQSKYPLDMVVNFDLEIDCPFTKECVSKIEELCSKAGIPFWRIRPRQSFYDYFARYGMPGFGIRWCNNLYKLDAKRQLHSWLKSQKCRPVAYIGFCADETKRFKYNVGEWNAENELQDECYPLAEDGILEEDVLTWAKEQPVFSGWYRLFKRQGCMFCPFLTMKALAFMKTRYPDKFKEFIRLWKDTIQRFGNKGFKWCNGDPDRLIERLEQKYIPMLEEE